MTDPIADLLTRIRNASAINKETATVPYSKIKFDIVQTMITEGYLADVKIINKDKPQKELQITLKYVGKHPAISKINRVSKPGRRVYQKARDIKPILSGHGISILSTNQGIMTHQKAQKANLGGEIICNVW